MVIISVFELLKIFLKTNKNFRMVAIKYKDDKKNTNSYICGGTLVSDTRTVTGMRQVELFANDVIKKGLFYLH